MPDHDLEVTSTTNGTFPALPLPPSNAHLAPVAPTLEAEGVVARLGLVATLGRLGRRVLAWFGA